jgi:sec-independent protein translocase protein TatC
MSLIEHLEELRKRIIRSIIALTAGVILAFAFKSYLLQILVAPLNGRELITLSPTESFMTVLKVAGYAGMILASPVIIFQIWAFVAPGLKSKERRVIYFASFFTTVLFLVGIFFAWYMVLPRGLDVLLNYQGDYFNQHLQADQYFSLVSVFLLGFGIIFETPVMILTLARLGIVNTRMLRKNRKYAILVGTILSAALTPGQDMFSMLMMAVPFLLLFEVSVLASRFVQKSKRIKDEVEEIEVEDGSAGDAAG